MGTVDWVEVLALAGEYPMASKAKRKQWLKPELLDLLGLKGKAQFEYVWFSEQLRITTPEVTILLVTS